MYNANEKLTLEQTLDKIREDLQIIIKLLKDIALGMGVDMSRY